MAFSRSAPAIFYVPSNEWGMDIWNEPITFKKGAAYLGARASPSSRNYEDSHRLPESDRPATPARSNGKYKNDAPLWSGVMTTAGGLVFYRHTRGQVHRRLSMMRPGKSCGPSRPAPASSASLSPGNKDGEQYVTVISGWGGAVPLWGGEVAKKVKLPQPRRASLWTFKPARSSLASRQLIAMSSVTAHDIRLRPPPRGAALLTCGPVG